MKKYLKKQQVEKMFKDDINIITFRKNIDEQVKQIYWLQLLTSVYKHGGITRRQYNKWSYSKICD